MRLRGHLAVFLLALSLVAVYTWPLVRDPAHLVPDNTDPKLFTWVMLSVFRNLLTRPALLLDGSAFYPMGNSLTFAEPLVTPALVAGPLAALGGSPILAYNLTLLLFWALSGWATYAVAFWLTRDHGAALVAMLVFTLAPPRTEYAVEFQMEMAFGLPLAVYALVRFLEEQRTRYLLALLAVFWLQAVAVWYYAVILAFGLAVIALQYAALRWCGWRPRTFVASALGGGALALALLPVARPFFVTRRELGFERGLADAVGRSADVLTYFGSRATTLYRGFWPGYSSETSLFVGAGGLALVALGALWLRRPGRPRRTAVERGLAAGVWAGLALAVLILLTRGRLAVVPFSAVGAALLVLALARQAVEGWQRRRHGVEDRRLGEREWVGLLLVLAAFAMLLSLGPEASVAGRPLGPGLYAWLYPYLLPLRAIRGATRFGLLAVFAAALLAGFGVAWLAGRVSRRTRAIAVGVVVAVLLAEYVSFPMRYVVEPSPLRPVDAVIRADRADVVVLELPINVPGTDTDAMFRSLAHGKRVVNGFAGFVSPWAREISGYFTEPAVPVPGPDAEAALRRIHPLRYLVVRLTDRAFPRALRAAWAALREAPPPLLRFRGSFGDEDLYEVVPLPERGTRIERWVSYGYLRDHPVLRLRLRPRKDAPDLEQWAEVRLNDRPLQRVALDGPAVVTVRARRPLRRAAPNVIALEYGYRRVTPTGARYRIGRTAATSPGDLRVRSRGQPHGSASSIWFNGAELSPDGRGYNLVALDPRGRLLRAAAFDTFADPTQAAELAAWIASLPGGTIVAGAVRDEASARLSEEAVRALSTLGVAGDLRGRFRESHAFVGVKGGPPGSALEALAPRPVELTVGRLDPQLGFEVSEFTLEPPERPAR